MKNNLRTKVNIGSYPKKDLKHNAINLAKHHRKYCIDGTCNVSLYLLKVMLDLLDIKLTDEERKLFL